MESVWTLTEVVRFKLIRPSAFDKDFPTDASEGPSKPIGQPDGWVNILSVFL